MDRDKMSIMQRGPSIDASYQVSLHLAEGFQRGRLKCEKLTDDRRRMPSDGQRQCELKIKINCKFFWYKNVTWLKLKRVVSPYVKNSACISSEMRRGEKLTFSQ
jgi:hypothetical protein